MKKTLSFAWIIVLLMGLAACDTQLSSNREMLGLLARTSEEIYSPDNPFCSQARLKHFNSLLASAPQQMDSAAYQFAVAQALLELGHEENAIAILDYLMARVFPSYDQYQLAVMKSSAIAHLRLGERMNCINAHAGESCIFPIAGSGVHYDRTGSEKAIRLYERILRYDPGDLESRWLLNIAYMTTGGYPQQVPPGLLIEGLDTDTSHEVKSFIDFAVNTGLHTKNMAGGSIVEDFNNDGHLDLVTSSWGLDQAMHYCKNNGDGSFSDVSAASGLGAFTGGLNIMQTDYNNDGLKDIFVLRGAWMREFGRQPNSLLKNNGDGTFTDVTHEAGLLSFHPTQTATWADFNNDGWVDVFIGNETVPNGPAHPCELYMNSRNGTFTEIAKKAGCGFSMFVKGVTSGDYDHDGLPDIFISTLNGPKILLKNETRSDTVRFKNVTAQAGLDKNVTRTFPTWFWDYDNDGWLDILVCGYEYEKSLAWYAAAEALKIQTGNSGYIFLFKNKQDGTFEEVTHEAGLKKIAFAMGSNFGDIDNDGYLDFYLGTGNPMYQSLVPNKMFRNKGGKRFSDVTTSARVGNLQKGHGVSFADFDNDGDQDIYIDMGGAYIGDAYQNSLYLNPGQNDNNWIKISLEGTKCNKAAIGTKLKVHFEENGVSRFVYRELNSGGSFGSNPLLQHIGIGQAKKIHKIEIVWPGSKTPQVFTELQPNETIFIKEGSNQLRKTTYARVDFTKTKPGAVNCAPF